MAERMTGCPVSWKCLVAWRPGEESQQPTWPHVLHSRNSTHSVPSFRHSSQALGVLGGGKSRSVRCAKCSQGVLVFSSFWTSFIGDLLFPTLSCPASPGLNGDCP